MASPLDSINWNYVAPTTVNVFFAAGGVAVDDGEGVFTTSTWDATELARATAAFQNFSDICNVQFNYVASIDQADFVMFENPDQAGVAGNLGYWQVGGGTLDYGGTQFALDGWGVFNSDDDENGVQGDAGDSWSHANLAAGAYGYITLIHEIGHGMGLAHPHDTGGGSTVMQGVTPDVAFGDYGDFGLNQGVFTTMSYNDGWPTAPHVPERQPFAENYGFGWQGTLMALDIAMLQQKYGANTTFHTGDDIYTLDAVNGVGTYYECIWDAGGIDTISYGGSAHSVINLNAATITYSPSGGGLVSYVQGIFGGFTIACDVVIERAIGGSGADTLIGSSADNLLTGGLGNDTLAGNIGHDTLAGQLGNDTYVLGAEGSGVDTISDTGGTADLITTLISRSLSFAGFAQIERLTLVGTAAINGIGNNLNNAIAGNNAANVINAGAGNDTVRGLGGSDTIYGSTGNDNLGGGPGNDRFVFHTAPNTLTNRDSIGDFANVSGNNDAFLMENAVFTKLGAGAAHALNPAFFRAGASALDANDYIVYNRATGALAYDSNGNAGGGAVQVAVLTNKPVLAAGDFVVI
jgi:Ca2+-binding RTX toxin-like protein